MTTVHPDSVVEYQGTTYACATIAPGAPWLGIRGDMHGFIHSGSQALPADSFTWFPASPHNAALLRRRLPWLNPVPLGLKTSFGFGDRLGLATPGHIAAVRGSGIAPLFAQQSVRENKRTGRTPQEVLDDAMWAILRAGWRDPWGADADHLKTPEDVPAFTGAGYSFFTVDPGEYVDNAADHDATDTLQRKAQGLDWEEMQPLYLKPAGEQPWGKFDLPSLLKAVVKYGRAIRHTVHMYHTILSLKAGAGFDFEISVDETEAPTSPLEHYFIASELKRQGVRLTSLAPRFSGAFEKGVDYIGDLAALDAEMADHAAVTAHFGDYKLSLHSGSDKFSVYPLVVKHWGTCVHVKTAGTSYLEALRVLARYEPALFEAIYQYSRQRYAADRLSYHVSARVEMIPAGLEAAALLDDFHAREVLHVTFGSVLDRFGADLHAALLDHAPAYQDGLARHFERHLAPFIPPEEDLSWKA
ncbi:MAG: tagaturonate epimerase family protein [Anaerolineaceae bacterium]|jgi:hypothetical protein|nr:tagaturonate epimerase family protein [Anaerolineaceae bacterium]